MASVFAFDSRFVSHLLLHAILNCCGWLLLLDLDALGKWVIRFGPQQQHRWTMDGWTERMDPDQSSELVGIPAAVTSSSRQLCGCHRRSRRKAEPTTACEIACSCLQGKLCFLSFVVWSSLHISCTPSPSHTHNTRSHLVTHAYTHSHSLSHTPASK